MVAVKGKVIIARQPQEVFDFVANGENEPRYNPHMRVAKKVTDGPIGVGTSFRQEIMGRRKVIPMTTQFTEFDRPGRIAEVSTWTGGTSTGEVTFEPVNGSTLMRWSWDVQAHGVLRYLGPVVASMGGGRSGGFGTCSSTFSKRSPSSRSKAHLIIPIHRPDNPPASTKR